MLLVSMLYKDVMKRQCDFIFLILFTSAVNLSYDVFDGKNDDTPLVFLHGLFGSKSNFHSIAKSLVQRTGRKVLTVDARNHGTSPHCPELTYEIMSADLKLLLSQLRIDRCVLIGHSMGGKTAMTTALTQVSVGL
uniref:sn-1-specific diacylglycerol lipase ABHD11 n=1 Tax=Periophthalmus magnuspinnatus TaxID=409849 RepID=A0A3B4B6D9_9GOBI